MSWFSRPFSDSFTPSAEGLHQNRRSCAVHNDDDEEPRISAAQASDAHGKGVSEDLSQLTKTFTRQLWGVASFLVAPPQTHCSQTYGPHPSEATAVSHALRSSGSESHSELPADSVETREELLSNELVEIDCETSEADISQGYRNAMLDVSKPHLRSERRLNGIGKDLAELRGSVATGFSKIMKVVREEVDRDQLADVSGSDLEGEFNPSADESESTANTPQPPGIDTFIRPLFGRVLQEGKGTSLNREISRRLKDSDPTVRLESDEKDSDRRKKIQQAVGITEEVLTFARNISMHPETWLDFPLLSDDEDDDEYEMSDAQKEHVSQVELASPRLAALRIELCPDYMSKGCFWKIYFVLLHSRLTRKDAVLLSTPQIVEARAHLLKKLQNRDLQGSRNVSSENEALSCRNKLQEQDGIDMSKSLPEKPSGMESFKIVSLQAATEISSKDFHQIEDHPGAGDDRAQRSSQSADYGEEIQNKNILASTVKLAALKYEEEEADADKWLDEEPSPHVGSGVYFGNDEDVSFSDLEEEDDLLSSKAVGNSITKRSYGWVQLNKSQNFQEFEGLMLSKMNKAKGVVHIDPGGKGLFQDSGSQSWDQVSKKPERGVSSDWLAVEEKDVVSAHFQ